MRTLYEEIRAQLETEITDIHVRLWNNQVDLSDKGEQIPFATPAVFIDFPNMEWSQVGKGVQTCNLTISFYLVSESFHTDENEEDLAIFDLREDVYLALQDFKATDNGKLMRVNEQTDTSHTNLYVWKMDYICTYTDTTAQRPRGNVSAEINTLVLTEDLQIDAGTVNGIRTDNEFD